MGTFSNLFSFLKKPTEQKDKDGIFLCVNGEKLLLNAEGILRVFDALEKRFEERKRFERAAQKAAGSLEKESKKAGETVRPRY